MWELSKIWMMNFCDAGSEAFKHDRSPSLKKIGARKVKLNKSFHLMHEIYARLNAPTWPLHCKQRMASNYRIDDNHIPAQEWMARNALTTKQFLNFLGWKGFKLMRYLPGYEQPFSGIHHLQESEVWTRFVDWGVVVAAVQATSRVGDGGFWWKNTKDAGFGGGIIGWFVQFQGGKKGLGRLGRKLCYAWKKGSTILKLCNQSLTAISSLLLRKWWSSSSTLWQS